MITELWYEGFPLDLYENTNIKHTLQINDVAEVKDRQASFTDTFKLPKTPNNVKCLGGLSIHSDTSVSPYLKPNVLLKIDGYDFLTKAWLQVKSTDDEYDVSIYSGIIEFFKMFENKTIGGEEKLVTLLAELNHNKNLDTVIDTQNDDTLKYQYLFADFYGRTHRKADPSVINIDYVVPSVPVSFIFEKIHEYAEYTFDGEFQTDPDYQNWFISYPKAPEDTSSVTYFEETKINNFNFNGQMGSLNSVFNFSFNNGGAIGIKILEKGEYNINALGGYSVEKPIPSMVSGNTFVNFYYSINNGPQIPLPSVFKLTLYENDVLNFYSTVISDWKGIVGIELTIKQLEDVSFTEEFKDLKITEFLKDVYNIMGLTPIVNNVTKNIKYLTNSERFKNTATEDWSDYLVSVDKETYSFGTYAQKNTFKYKYNDQEDSQSDGFFEILNKNLEEEKTVFTSFTYSVEKEQTSNFYLNSSLSEKAAVYKLYEKEPQEGTTELKYKPLSKRYFYLRMKKVFTPVTIGSDIQTIQITNNVIKFGEFRNLTMANLVSKNYLDFKNVVSNTRIWNVTLKLPYPKLLKIDLTKAYYFKQLQQYCFINKISFDEKKTTAELVRLKDFRV